jgi:hypothetical protein
MVAKIQRDADGRTPNFIIGYLRDQPFRNGAPRQPVYHAKFPERVDAICGAAVIVSSIMHMPIGWKNARVGTKVSCPKCKTLIKRATDTRPKLRLKQPKPVKPKKAPRRDRKLAAWAAAEAARIKPPPALHPRPMQFHNRIGSPPGPGKPPPAMYPTFLKRKPPSDPELV